MQIPSHSSISLHQCFVLRDFKLAFLCWLLVNMRGSFSCSNYLISNKELVVVLVLKDIVFSKSRYEGLLPLYNFS